MPPPLIAFGIAHLPMLGWLAAAAAPILIHLWSRRRYREMSWAAMEYLLAAARRQSRRLLLEQWLLLAVRTLLVVLIVLAVAEPYLERSSLATGPAGHTHRVLVIDGSYSMAYQPTDKTRFERARQMARQMVEESPQGDAFTLILMSSPPRVVVGRPAIEPSEILREIDNLRLTHAAADVPATVRAIRQVVDAARAETFRLARHEVYFLTDLQRLSWAPKLAPSAAADFQRQADELSQLAALFLIDLGQPSAENLAVTGLRALEPPWIVGRSVRLEAELRNFGDQARRRQPVELLVDGQRIEQKQVNVGPRAAASVAFSYRFDAAGDHAVEVRAAGDALDVDNHRFLAVPVRQTIRALCIDGRPGGKSFRGAADYLAVALTPEAAPAGRAAVAAEVAPETAIMDRNLARYPCLFCCNVAQFTASEARILDAYLRGGGNLVFFLGDQVLPERYNQELGAPTPRPAASGRAGQGRTGRQISPLPLGEGPGVRAANLPSPSGRGAGGEGGVPVLIQPRIRPAQLGPVVDHASAVLDPLGYRHPIVQPFRGRGETALLTTPVQKYYRLQVPQDSPVKTVLALGNGDPLIVEQPVHRGRVVLVATSADTSWTYMPLCPSFVPLVQEIVAWCLGGQLEQQNLLVGEPLSASLPLAAAQAPATVQGPDGRSRSVQLRAAAADAALSYPDTAQSGIYVARFGAPLNREQIFAVNVDTAESDLAQIDAEQLQNDVWPDISFIRQTSWQGFGAAGPGHPTGSRSRLHVGLLYAVLGLLLGETFLAWRMGHDDGLYRPQLD
jgi:hypothetical protein